MTEPPVVNASPLIYLAHADLFHLLKTAGPLICVPRAVSTEIRRRGPGDPTVQAIRAASWLQEVELAKLSPRVEAWGHLSSQVLEPALRLVGE